MYLCGFSLSIAFLCTSRRWTQQCSRVDEELQALGVFEWFHDLHGQATAVCRREQPCFRTRRGVAPTTKKFQQEAEKRCFLGVFVNVSRRGSCTCKVRRACVRVAWSRFFVSRVEKKSSFVVQRRSCMLDARVGYNTCRLSRRKKGRAKNTETTLLCCREFQPSPGVHPCHVYCAPRVATLTGQTSPHFRRALDSAADQLTLIACEAWPPTGSFLCWAVIVPSQVEFCILAGDRSLVRVGIFTFVPYIHAIVITCTVVKLLRLAAYL